MSRFWNWFHARSPRGQWAVGCAASVLVVTICLYGLGVVSYVMRPTLVTTLPSEMVIVAVPTGIIQPTFAPPTAPPTLMLPNSTLPATPTQAPIPTRAPPTNTPIYILDPNGTPVTITPFIILNAEGTPVTVTPNPFETPFGAVTLVPEP